MILNPLWLLVAVLVLALEANDKGVFVITHWILLTV